MEINLFYYLNTTSSSYLPLPGSIESAKAKKVALGEEEEEEKIRLVQLSNWNLFIPVLLFF